MKRKATLIRIFGYLLQHKRQLAFILSLSFLGNLLALAGPRLSGAAINLIAEGMDGISMRPLCCCFMCPALL